MFYFFMSHTMYTVWLSSAHPIGYSRYFLHHYTVSQSKIRIIIFFPRVTIVIISTTFQCENIKKLQWKKFTVFADHLTHH